MPGTLYVIATPIGNLDDLSPRAVRTLRSVAVVACEDTRHTGKLLRRFEIATPTISYHEHNEKKRAAELVERLLGGEDVGLVSDAGTPGISDPGYRLVRLSRQNGVPVRSVPGPSAIVSALAVSGLPTSRFCFYGFLPTRPAARKTSIDALAAATDTVLVFESPRRTPALLEELAARMGEREAFLAREMTKLHEEHRWGSLDELARWARETPLRGEVTLVIAPAEEAPPEWEGEETRELLGERFRALTTEGLTRREAVKRLARESGLPARRVYRELLDEEES